MSCSFIAKANISLSTYRVFLNEEHRLASFTVYNKSVNQQKCNIRFRHYDYNDSSEIVEYKGEGRPNYSALPWFRMSPKTFTLAEKGVQKVNFSMRRKVQKDPAEYRSIIAINCKSDNDNSLNDFRQVSLAADLVFNIPLTVRTGNLKAKIDIQPISLNNNSLKLRLLQEGERSLFGKISIFQNDELITYLKNISIYPSVKYKEINLDVSKLGAGPFNVVFEESDDMPNKFRINKEIEI